MEKWFLTEFKDTAFNTEGPLPAMSGEPCTIHLNEDAVPHSVFTPIQTPFHHKQKMWEQIDKDVKSGILRLAPANKPTKFCSQQQNSDTNNKEKQ